MASMAEHQNSMTIFYRKRDGEIRGYATGIQDMSFYGDNAEDFSLIWDYVVLERDRQVLDNIEKFKINTETKEIELLPEHVFQPDKYKIAD
ncbi:hypothetical protein FYJ27_08660 [Anaerosalibacter bizertensis]|uniref:Uncharacterized protein n=1 Tax=Anaerosalibacter bizertensis TaxID=932217 RepID=A0A844FIP4_9FIRM|nr:hypothetical protein [Anaerosalibacter bizertensis]MSS43798.1 hypothetical protein [Anaerosalibacter bizertensis]